jgi:TQXA domain-containing protein
MITALRQRRRRRASTIVVSLVAALGLVVGLAGPASAASVAKFLGLASGQSATIRGSYGGHDGIKAGLFDVVIDGEVETFAYCIDLHTPIPNETDLDEIEWETSGVANLEKVEVILAHYHPNGTGPEGYEIDGTDAQKAAATQAAIWHYTDDYQLKLDDSNDATIVSNYETILAAVDSGEFDGFGEPTVSLSITPPETTEGVAGALVGPYVINTSAESATLTPSEGLGLFNEDGSPFSSAVVDGTEVWLSSESAGAGTLSATASAEVGAGRVFFSEGVQRLILASTVTTDAAAEAAVSFTPGQTTSAPTTSTTSSTSTTSTTVPITPQTTVVDTTTTTTTVPAVPVSNSGGGLPVTGAQSLVLVGIALVLVVVGAGFGIVSRRKRLES